MSAYIVDSRTIDRVLFPLFNDSDNRFFYIKKSVGLYRPLDFTIFGRKLLALNTEAVNQRYSEINSINHYEFESIFVSKIQSYKSLQCLIYQCTEGSVPHRRLYKFLKAYSDALGYFIISSLSEYNDSEWA